jgi:TolB-like protein/Flp pilus assembly protein TadD
MSFLAELRRRKVFQVAIGYLAVAWLLVQVTATILPAFDLPVWALRFIVLLFALGFPIAVLMAWALELTPEGVRLDVGTSGGKGMLAIAAVLMAVVLGWFFRGQVFPTQHVAQAAVVGTVSPQPKVEKRSIAVLPLVNASNDPDQQFFSDGISENLIDALSKYDELKVIGRTSSFLFRDGKDDSKAIGAKLGVSYLVSGSVQRVGDAVRISVELVDTRDGSTVWTQRFDRPYKDLFALQDDIVLAVAGALQVNLMNTIPAAVESGRPASGNLDAYTAFLRGSAIIYGSPPQAIEQFKQAIQFDPEYAQAWQWLGYEHVRLALGTRDDAQRRAACAQARKEIETAIKLAPDYPLAYAGLGLHLTFCDFDWNGAMAAFHKFLPLASGTSPGHGAYSRLLGALGKIDEATVESRKMVAGSPLSLSGYSWLAELLASQGALDEAEATAKKAIEVSPDDADWPISVLSGIAILRGDATAALAEAGRMSPGDDRDSCTALALQIGDDRAAADAALRRLLDGQGNARSGLCDIARVYALRGDPDRTIEWLDRAWQRHDASLLRVLSDPILLRFRDDPRFIAFYRKIGLPPPSESEALSIDKIRALSSNRQARS